MSLSELNSENSNIESILLVDDKPANLKVLSQMLKGKNYKVKKAIDGETAILAAQSSPPDLILLDIMMPDMDGYEVCSILKSNPKTENIPIIFISALNDVFDKVKAFEVGGIDYVSKPFQEEEVLARINSQLTIQSQKKLLEKEQKILIQEIRQRKETEAILYQSRAIISSILNSSLDAIAAVEAVRNPITGEIEDFRCLVVNPIIAKTFEREAEDLTGRLVVKKFINKVNPQLFPALIDVVETGIPLDEEREYHYKQKRKWFHYIVVKLGDGFSITVRDITKKKQLELKLNKLATTDSLTNVYNRHSFDLILKKQWQKCSRQKQPLSLIICDVDFFKDYNDFYGHQKGDECLIQIAQTLDSIAQRHSHLTARYGGEEFAIILPNASLEDATQIAQTMRQQVESLNIPHQKSSIASHITLSLGLTSIFPTSSLNQSLLLKLLIKKADSALYQAKNNGRNQLRLETIENNNNN